MNDIFVVDSYAKSAEQVDMLASMVDYLTKANREICLVSHLPIPGPLVSENVKFVLYDSNNVLGPDPLKLYFKAANFEIRYSAANHYHGAAVYTNLYNALKLLAHRYEWVHFVECDIDVEAIRQHLDGGFNQFKSDRATQVIGYSSYGENPAAFPTAMLTSLLSLRPEIVESFPHIGSWDDFLRFNNDTELILEAWLLQVLRTRNLKYVLLNAIATGNKFKLTGDHSVIKCRQQGPLYRVFVINLADRMIEVTWNTGMRQVLVPRQMVWQTNANPSTEVTVSYIGTNAIYHHSFESMRRGAFRVDGQNLCPDWT